MSDDQSSLAEQVARLETIYRIGIALSAERNRDRLIESILLEAKKLCNADGGTLYLVTEDDHLRFAIMRSDSLGIAKGGTTGEPIDLPPIPIFDPKTKRPNHKNVATYCASCRQSVNITDAYATKDFDFSGTKRFDEHNKYRSKSFLTIPLFSGEEKVIGVLQLINARDRLTNEVIPFAEGDQKIVEALASQAGIALDNQQLLEGQKVLLESFIKLIAAAIDAKSPYTGGHCERVPVITLMLAEAACQADHGPLAEFNLSEDEWYELKIAAWLHDCGKVTTPVHVMDKATKLETIFDRITVIRERFEILRRDVKIRYLEGVAAGGDANVHKTSHDAEMASLDDDLRFLEVANVGGEFLDPEKKARIRRIAEREYTFQGKRRPLLDKDEIANLSISRGTLSDSERITINGHMVQTIKMLEALPFPKHLRRVPEYAGGHHEKMDGGGYPKGLYAGDMSVPARIMAIADVFEALTAQDRPYKPGKTLSESMRIMGFMKKDNHLDPDLFDLFVRSGVYKEYGKKFLPQELIDEVDEEALLAIEPKSFDAPPEEERRQRWQDFLPEYRGRS